MRPGVRPSTNIFTTFSRSLRCWIVHRAKNSLCQKFSQPKIPLVETSICQNIRSTGWCMCQIVPAMKCANMTPAEMSGAEMVSKNNSHDPFILSCGFYCRVACITRNFSESQTPRFIFESGFKSRTGHNGTHRELKICKIWNIFWTLYNSFFHKL